jgi:hypothetical protein
MLRKPLTKCGCAAGICIEHWITEVDQGTPRKCREKEVEFCVDGLEASEGVAPGRKAFHTKGAAVRTTVKRPYRVGIGAHRPEEEIVCRDWREAVGLSDGDRIRRTSRADSWYLVKCWRGSNDADHCRRSITPDDRIDG